MIKIAPFGRSFSLGGAIIGNSSVRIRESEVFWETQGRVSHHVFVVHGINIHTNVFTHKANSQCVRESTDFERPPAHCSASEGKVKPRGTVINDSRVNHIGVTNHSRGLGITVTPLRAFVDVRRTNNDQSIIYDHRLQSSQLAGSTEFLHHHFTYLSVDV